MNEQINITAYNGGVFYNGMQLPMDWPLSRKAAFIDDAMPEQLQPDPETLSLRGRAVYNNLMKAFRSESQVLPLALTTREHELLILAVINACSTLQDHADLGDKTSEKIALEYGHLLQKIMRGV